MSRSYEHDYPFRQPPTVARITWATQRLILITLLVYCAQLILEIPLGSATHTIRLMQSPGGEIINHLAFQPTEFLRGKVWTPFTYMFLHSSLSHLVINMLTLYFFGTLVERTLGSRQFLRFYVLCGIFSVFAEMLLLPLHSDPSVVGASGAAMGVLMAFVVIDPNREIFLFPLPFPLTARAVLIVIVILNLVAAVRPNNMAWATHFGGLAVGYVYMKIVPRLRRRRDARMRAKLGRDPNEFDRIGEAVNNIFRFDFKKRSGANPRGSGCGTDSEQEDE